jgi:hypothetical protein
MRFESQSEDYADRLIGPYIETSPEMQNSEVSKPSSTAQTRQNPCFVQIGKVCAINTILLSVAANFPRRQSRGGANNRADRPSYGLKPAQAAKLKAAQRHSDAIGLPFTRMITIHWKAAGVALASMVKATGTFIDKLTKWLARRGHETAWLWVHENAGDKCWHCHILIHIPAGVVEKLPAAQKRWLRQITGKAYAKRVIKSVPIGGRLDLHKGNRELYLVNCQAALTYLLKGAISESQSATQGLVLGKRCGMSQNIGRAARLRNGKGTLSLR